MSGHVLQVLMQILISDGVYDVLVNVQHVQEVNIHVHPALLDLNYHRVNAMLIKV